MALKEEQLQQLQEFFNHSAFSENGAVITDLDGTAIHEYQGVYSIPQEVEFGLKRIYDLGRPVVLNTLRFPLSVIRTFGREWYRISNAPIPTVLMNGSLLGYIREEADGNIGYEEIEAFPLLPDEISLVMQTVETLIKDGITDLLVFYYPRNWRLGEIIWTPELDKVQAVQNKYMSAAQVVSSSLSALQHELHSQDICMIFLLINVAEDKLMAYQHAKQSNFFTHEGANKLSGAERIAGKLGFELKNSLGAGDTVMDTFLQGVGQAVHVGNPYLDYHGLLPTIKVKNSSELGDLLFTLAAMQRTVTS